MSTHPAPTEAPPTPQTAIAPRQRIDVAAFEANDPRALYMNTGLFDQLQRVASMMSKANVVPEHLRGEGKLADCFLVVSQAFRWGMDPFAVAQCTFVTKGKLGYEGKLIAAVVNVSGRLRSALSYAYSGSGDERRVSVSGQFKGEDAARTIEGTVKLWRTDNQKWKEMPDQMLAYRGAREWARRHMPEAVLGVQAEEEVEAITVAPVEEPRVSAIEAAKERLRASTREVPPAPVEEPKPEEAAPAAPCKHQPLWRIAAHTDPGKRLVCPEPGCGGEFTPAEISAARRGE